MSTEVPGRVEMLLTDYTTAREDERGFLAVQATLVSLILAALSFLILALTNDCRFGTVSGPGCAPQTPDVVLASMSLVPLALLSYLQALATAATIRSFYMRALEREIRDHAVDPVMHTGTYPGMQLMSYIETLTAVGTLARGRGAIRVLFGLLVAIAGVVLIGVTVAAGLLVPLPLKLAMGLVYGFGTVLILREAVSATIKGSDYYCVAVGEATRRMAQPLGGAGSKSDEKLCRRALWSYLALPRPDDLIKATFFPVTILYGVISSISTRESVETFEISRAAIYWIALELLIYSARYQVNDIRGAAEDMRHPHARGRLPFDPKDNGSFATAARASMVVIVVRLYVVTIIASVPQWDLAVPMLATTVAVFGLAVLYEFLRWVESRRHCDLAAWMIYIVVGWGYVIRGAAALWVLGVWSLSAMPDPNMTLWLLVFFASYGSMFVVLTWVLDAASYSLDDLDNVSSGSLRHMHALDDKPHLAYLLRQNGYNLIPAGTVPMYIRFAVGGTQPSLTGARAEPGILAPPVKAVTAGSLSRPLSRADRSVTPQLVVTALAVAAAVAAGVAASGLTQGFFTLALLGVSAGAVLSVVARGARLIFVVTATAIAALWTFVQTASVESTLTIVTPIALCMWTAVIFRAQRYVDLKYGMEAIAVRMRRQAIMLMSIVFGRRVMLSLLEKHQRSADDVPVSHDGTPAVRRPTAPCNSWDSTPR